MRDAGSPLELPPAVRDALEGVFGAGATRGVAIVQRPAFVRCHLLCLGSLRGRGSTTRPERIYTNLDARALFAPDPRMQLHLLHEFFHVVRQWRTGMTIPRYLATFRAREAAATAFAREHLAAYASCVARA